MLYSDWGYAAASPQPVSMAVRPTNMNAKLKAALNNKKLCLFTGAGVSFASPASLPLGNELVYDFFLQSLLPTDLFTSLPKGKLRPEVVMNALCKHLGEGILSCMSIFNEAEPNQLHAILYSLLEAGVFKKIVTTNLDLCHERALTQDNTDGIIHLHGRIDDHSSILYSLDQVASKRSKSVIEQVRAIFSGVTVLFVGYSGRDDFDISPALRDLPSSTHFIWVDHHSKADGYEVTDPDESCDPYSILRDRLRRSWIYVRGNTFAFCLGACPRITFYKKQTPQNWSQIVEQTGFSESRSKSF